MQIRIVIVEIAGEINLGSICRLMKNFGFDELYLVNPKLDLNKLSTAYGFAMHAKELINDIKVVTSLKDALADVDAIIGTTAIPASTISNPLRVPIPPEELQNMIDHYIEQENNERCTKLQVILDKTLTKILE